MPHAAEGRIYTPPAAQACRRRSIIVPRAYVQSKALSRLERFPITWNHRIEKEPLNFKEVQHGGIEKVAQILRNMLQIDAERITAMKTPRLDDQGVCEIAVNPPIIFLVRIGQIAARGVAANPEAIDCGLVRPQTYLNVAQAFAESQLRDGHAQKLIQMRDSFLPDKRTDNVPHSDTISREKWAAAENP